MIKTSISRRAALTATVLTAAAAGVRAYGTEAQAAAPSAQGEKYLQTILKFWKFWETDPIDVDGLAAMFTEDCIIRVGVEGNVVSEGKQAGRALLKNIAESAHYKITVPRSFVTGRVVVTEFDFSSSKTKGGPMKAAPGHYAGVFIFKGDKIWMWTDVES